MDEKRRTGVERRQAVRSDRVTDQLDAVRGQVQLGDEW
jgi:hypothetical protein